MFKLMTTLFRARTADLTEALSDANVLTVLRQQLRDAAEGLESAKRGVAVVMAYADREKKAALRIAAQASDLEARAIQALRIGRDDLATEAASTIAELEAEAQATARAIAHYDTEIARLRDVVSLSEQRLRTVQRGKHIADAAERTQKLRGALPGGVQASLRDAEATLERLQARQSQADAVDLAMGEMSSTPSVETTAARLAAAGCGAPLRPAAADVLARLREKAA